MTTKTSVPLALVGGAVALVLFGFFLLWHARSSINKTALASQARGVTAVTARETTYRPSRRYVGTLDPWVQAKVGPQFISAYVDTVLVRPGDAVKRGQVLATLDCRNSSALNKAVAAQARAVQSMQEAVSHESKRISELGDGGFVSPNEVEQKSAESASKESQYLALEAQMVESSLKVNDCILRAPFDGDIADRIQDPGAFVRPGMPIVTVVDRRLIRLTADVPEEDFTAASPETTANIRVTATGEAFTLPISRRSPAADPATRTIHIEIDIPDPQRRIPVFTTAEISIEVGEAISASQIPLAAASIRGKKASLFLIGADNKAHASTVAVLGEKGGTLYLSAELKSGSLVVLEGRTLLSDGDSVTFQKIESDEEIQARAAPAKNPSDASGATR